MNYYTQKTSLILTLLLLVASCNTKNSDDMHYTQTRNLELGVVQKEIHEGMSQDQVAIALGSPNIVTHDKNKKEAWIYDKMATEVRHSGSSGFIFLCLLGGSTHVSKTEKSQKTLTVVIKFDSDSLVESVSYHSSKF